MKYVKTPQGDIFLCEQCEFFDEVDLKDNKQKLKEELFDKHGVLIAENRRVVRKNE